MKYFGTDGIRSRAGEPPLDRCTIAAIGEAIGKRVQGRILIGRDPRESSPWICKSIADGMRRGGSEPEDAGVLPTPGVALLVSQGGYAGGVMISASHNPYYDNGIKLFGGDGRKLTDVDEQSLEDCIDRLLDETGSQALERTEQEDARRQTGYVDRYLDLLGSKFQPGPWLKGFRVLMDCANGALSGVASRMIERAGGAVTCINADPNGVNINEACGAVHPEDLQRAMTEGNFDLGVAFDGDGDRSIFASPAGKLLDGDAILLLLAGDLLKVGQLKPPLVVGTLMTNFALEQELRRLGVELRRTRVGDRYIFEEMQATGAMLGGEPSGHVILGDFGLSGDSLLTTLRVLDVMQRRREPIDSLCQSWTPCPQLQATRRIIKRIPINEIPGFPRALANAEAQLAGRGRLVVRYSGTEPVLRLMVESTDEDLNKRLMKDLLVSLEGQL